MENSGHEARTSMPPSLWLPPAGIALIILALSSIPGKTFPVHPDFLNSIVHFSEFAVLSYLIARALYLSSKTKNLGSLLMTCFIVSVIFGAATEVYQFAIPQRLFDPSDILIDSVGALAGILVFWGRVKVPGA
jgi:VanZ family protein